jgi:hypothetical protein
VRVFGDDPTRNVSVCLRDRLDLAAAAALAYKHLSGSTVSERNAMIEPLMRHNVEQFDIMMEDDGLFNGAMGEKKGKLGSRTKVFSIR